MEKASVEMGRDDLWEGWEIIPKEGLLEFPKPPVFQPDGIFESNYFVCSSPRGAMEKDPDRESVKEIGEAQPTALMEPIKPDPGGDRDTFSQVFFKKLKETEFVDMKLDSPRSPTKGLKSPFEVSAIQFADKEEDYTDAGEEVEESIPNVSDPEPPKSHMGSGKNQKGCLAAGGLTIWRWRITGIGALCSIGVAAATICIFIIGSRQRSKQQHQNQKLRFQIYSDDKKIKQVVHHASKLNQALRGVPLTRASITFGGYYDGL